MSPIGKFFQNKNHQSTKPSYKQERYEKNKLVGYCLRISNKPLYQPVLQKKKILI